jgi:hypothetical protein
MDHEHNNSTSATPKPVWTVPKLIEQFAKLSISHTRTALIGHDKANPENDNAVVTLNPDVTVQVLLEQFAKLSIRDQKSISRILQSVDAEALGAPRQPRLIVFEPFCRLPPEIKDLIFDYALAMPRVIFIKPTPSEQSESRPKIFEATSYDVPLLRTCYQSRNRALWHYKRLSKPLARPVLVNPKLDVLFFAWCKIDPIYTFTQFYTYLPDRFTDNLSPFTLKTSAEKFIDIDRRLDKGQRIIRVIAIPVHTEFLSYHGTSYFAGVAIPLPLMVISSTLLHAAVVLEILDEFILIVTDRTTAGTKQLESMPFYEAWDSILGNLSNHFKYPKITILTQAEFDARMS